MGDGEGRVEAAERPVSKAGPRVPTRAEVGHIRILAQKLVQANDRRNPTSERATLGEEDAIFNLRWQLNELAARCNGG